MGIKSLTQTVKKSAPDSIINESLYKLSGKKIAVDASLIIYQQLLSNNKNFFYNSEGKITNHITGLFYKIMNYITLGIELIFIFDGKPPDNKQLCIQDRKEKSEKAKQLLKNPDIKGEEKFKLEKASTRVTKEMIDDVKQLLNLMGVSYIHPEVGEGEAYASELCRMGFVDYVLTEDMDSLVYGCPNLIRNCIDKDLKRKGVVSIFNYDKLIESLKLDHSQFVEFCILCGCDYCSSVPKIGNITALKLFQKHKDIETIIKNTNYTFPENYLETFHQAKKNFMMYFDNIDLQELEIKTSEKNVNGLQKYLIETVNMSEKRVNNTLKKFNNILKHA
jgi:flap endonuclease-1